MRFIFISCCLILSSCTYSINMVHTQGSASDVVDENQRADADVEPSLTIPGL